jgi:hypothetical protein
MVVWRGKTGPLAKGDLMCSECRGIGGPLVITTGPLGDWIDQSCPRCGGQRILKTARRQDHEDCPYCGWAGTLHWLGPAGAILNINCVYCVATGLVQSKGPGKRPCRKSIPALKNAGRRRFRARVPVLSCRRQPSGMVMMENAVRAGHAC